MISIIVPIYKVEKFLSRCIDSLLGQTYSDFELILVDDGSPDRCGEICDRYAQVDSRIRVIHKENGGLSDARNTGLSLVQGDYISFVDSDDWVAPQYLERLLKGLLTARADICECEVYRTSGDAFDEAISSKLQVQAFGSLLALKQLILDGEFHQHVWNKLYRREVIGDISFPGGKTNEDEFWTYQVFGKAGKIAKIADVLYNYYQRPNSIMGAEYSLKRLDSLEAKKQRQQYVERFFPELKLIAKINYYFSCVYAGQMAVKALSPEELDVARRCINEHVKSCELQRDEIAALTGGSKLWYQILQGNFWLGCRLRNFMGRGF